MKLLVGGSGGQVGRALVAEAPAGWTVIAPPESEFDVTDPAAARRWLADARPTALANVAAYTAVDRAETEAEIAERINAHAAGLLAAAAAEAGVRFVHVSTDFVFDGLACRPIPPEATPAPLGIYGATKLAGERAVAAADPDALVLRTAWVYAAVGNNFPRTMLRVMAERDEVRVVADQVGTPTHAAGLARAIFRLLGAGATGLHHWTDAGVASWYDFAVAIQEEALGLGLLDRPVPVIPIRTEDYPTPARRPAYSVLDKTATWAITGPARHWRVELRDCLAEMKETA
ncbi:MAG: dTDP-4-dehydrorhamnose reductase [Thermaurantiacus sp.]